MEGIDFDLFYPSKDRRNEFLENYVGRHSSRDFIMKIDNNWDNWIDEIENDENKRCHLHCLSKKGEFIGNNAMIITYVNQLTKRKMNKVDKQYLDLIKDIIENGVEKIQEAEK